MRSWAKAYGGLTVIAGIAYLIALLLGVIDGKLAFDASLQDYFAYKHFYMISGIAGFILVLAGIVEVYDGMRSKRVAIPVFGIVSILAGLIIASFQSISTGCTNWNDALLYLNIIFVAFGLSVIAKDSLNGYFAGAVVTAIITIVMDIAYIASYKDYSSAYFGYLVAVLVIVTGLLCYVSDRRYRAIQAAIQARKEAAAKKAEEEAAAKDAAAAAVADEVAKKYAEERAAAAKAAEDAAAKKAADEAAAKKKVADDAAAKKAAEEAAAKKAAEDAAAKKAADEAAAKKAEEEAAAVAAAAAAKEAEAKAAANVLPPFDVLVDACNKKGLEFGVNVEQEEITFTAQKLAVFVFDEPADVSGDAALESDGWVVIRFDRAEITDGAKEVEVIVDYLNDIAQENEARNEAAAAAARAEADKKVAEADAARKMAEAAAIAAIAASKKSAHDIIVDACHKRGLEFGADDDKDKITFTAQKLAVFVFEGAPNTSGDAALEKDGWTVIRFDGSEVTDGEKEAEVIIDYLAELEVDEEAAEPETIVIEKHLSNEDLGIEPETVETPVRRAAYNRGLRFRRNYGAEKIPVAFVTCKVAVYVTDGVPETAYDDQLKANGWVILRFDGAAVTDGEKEAEEIEQTIKQVTREKKAAAAKAKRAKARKAGKKD